MVRFRAYDERGREVLERFYINQDGVVYRSQDPCGRDMSNKDRIYPVNWTFEIEEEVVGDASKESA